MATETAAGKLYQLLSLGELSVDAAHFMRRTAQQCAPAKARLKRAGNRGNPGTVRRFAEVVMQLDVTWDLYSVSGDELIAMLPPEFDRFRR